MEWTDFLKVYGPMSIGWILAGYLIKFILDRYDSDMAAKVALAEAIQKLAEVIRNSRAGQ